MPADLTTAADLDALPLGSVVVDSMGDAWMKDAFDVPHGGRWVSPESSGMQGERVLAKYAPLRLVYRPDTDLLAQAERERDDALFAVNACRLAVAAAEDDRDKWKYAVESVNADVDRLQAQVNALEKDRDELETRAIGAELAHASAKATLDEIAEITGVGGTDEESVTRESVRRLRNERDGARAELAKAHETLESHLSEAEVECGNAFQDGKAQGWLDAAALVDHYGDVAYNDGDVPDIHRALANRLRDRAAQTGGA
jgi:hypothetical protein